MTPKPTNICPGCGYEYESWVEVCPDCNLPVSSRADIDVEEAAYKALAPDEDPQWTVAGNVPNAIIGSFIKSQLEDAGIPVLMLRSPSADIAQFSHNDYVPHDIRVPRHLVAQARSLIDSAPDVGDASRPAFGQELYGGSPISPQGWTTTTGEREPSTRTDPTEGWYWSDEQPVLREKPVVDELSVAEEDDDRFGAYEQEEDYDGEPDGNKDWIRIVYGILLTAISLPFIFQLLQQIASIFGAPPR